jgi:von Willebrand factor A domain-containing protein 8
MHFAALANKLKALDMSARNMEKFQSYKVNVQREIKELRVIIASVEAKNKERIWLKNKTVGDIGTKI